MGIVLGHIFNHVTKKVPPGKQGSAFLTRLDVSIWLCSLHFQNFYSFSFHVFLQPNGMYKKRLNEKSQKHKQIYLLIYSAN